MRPQEEQTKMKTKEHYITKRDKRRTWALCRHSSTSISSSSIWPEARPLGLLWGRGRLRRDSRGASSSGRGRRRGGADKGRGRRMRKTKEVVVKDEGGGRGKGRKWRKEERCGWWPVKVKGATKKKARDESEYDSSVKEDLQLDLNTRG